MKGRTRHAARLAAVEILYAADLRGVSTSQVLAERETEDPPPRYAEHLISEVDRRRDEIDALLLAKSIGWTVERMSPVDRNTLRVATLELLEGEVPQAAVITEAVEIAKHFSGERAGSFVNGVLGAIQRELQVSDAGRSGS